MRKASSNWLGKIIMANGDGRIDHQLRVWGIADIFKGWTIDAGQVGRPRFPPNNSASSIPRSCSRSAVSSAALTTDQACAFGLDRQLLQQTIAEAALTEARRLGLDPTPRSCA
jgi:peptidyl-prolyl cis-trans isomerase D